jgi:hypothetical protein
VRCAQLRVDVRSTYLAWSVRGEGIDASLQAWKTAGVLARYGNEQQAGKDVDCVEDVCEARSVAV